MKDSKLVSSGYSKGCACALTRIVCCAATLKILKGDEMIRYQSSSKWEDMEFPETKQMADEGGGHHAYVTNDLPDSMLLKCYQHCGSEWIYFEIVNIMCILVVNNILVGGGRGQRSRTTGKDTKSSSPGISSSNGSIGTCNTHHRTHSYIWRRCSGIR